MWKQFFLIQMVLLALSGCWSPGYFDLSDEKDDTVFLQSLLDSPLEEITIPARATPWQTGPLVITAVNKSIVFEKGCIIEAKKGGFRNPGDCLITIHNSENVRISGNGTILGMRKDDYSNKPYRKGEWRHGISLKTSKYITLEGFVIQNTGGDGVYIGQDRGKAVCEKITLRNLVLNGNHRQGVSVIAVQDFLMESCTVQGTKGTPPMAGIDFEPNSHLYGLAGCIIRNCIFEGNSGPGILIYLPKMTKDQLPVEIRFENCVSRKNLLAVSVYNIGRDVRGTVIFSGCTLSGPRWIQVPKSFTVNFVQP